MRDYEFLLATASRIYSYIALYLSKKCTAHAMSSKPNRRRLMILISSIRILTLSTKKVYLFLTMSVEVVNIGLPKELEK